MPAAAGAEKQRPERDLSRVSDWGEELQKRLDENADLEPEARESDYEVEARFFEDYFSNGDASWDANVADQLLSLGEPLKKVIKVLGFNKNVNPILGFITDDTVIRNLIRTKLLNINTFKAIYNAIAKKLVAHSEFFTANDYNIIYCQDLYRKSASEMETYLEAQKKILRVSASEYTKEAQDLNKKVFFYIANIAEMDIEKRKVAIAQLPVNATLPEASDPSTTLNSIDLINKLAGIDNTRNKTADTNKNSISLTGNTATVAQKLSNRANTAHAFAAIQYLSITTNTPEADKALQHQRFSGLTTEQIAAATTQITPIMKKLQLQADEVKPFIDTILDRSDREN
jgi:hypothetical protein